jgi:MFS family permease
LVSITNALNGFILRDWIVTSYLLTYTGTLVPNLLQWRKLTIAGFLVIYAKLSDVFGKKTMLLLALLIFTVFSGLCGAANNIVDLYVVVTHQSGKRLTIFEDHSTSLPRHRGIGHLCHDFSNRS